MDKEKIKNFIVTQRQNGVPDDQIYSFLQEKGAIAKPQAPEVAKETTAEKIAGFTGGKELAQGIGQALAQKEISAGIQDTMNQQIEIQGKLVKKLQEEKAAGLDTSKTEQALKYITDDLAKTSGSVEQQLNPNALTPGQVIGSSLQLATNALPGTIGATGMKTGKLAVQGTASKALAGVLPETLSATVAKVAPKSTLVNLAGKTGAGLATGYGLDVGTSLIEGESVKEALKPGLGTVIGGALPVGGFLTQRLILNPLGRVIKGLGSATGGVGTESLDVIMNNPKKASEITKALQKEGNIKILKDEAQTIMNGITQIKKEASKAYGEGLEQLASKDIKPDIFRASVQETLDNYGVSLKNGTRELANVEFTDPKNLQKASDLIDKLAQTDLDGKSLRKLVDDISNSAYKTATSDERLSYNIFVKDLADSVRGAINASTDKLSKINKQYATDIGLSDAVEAIYGKVKFRNLEELNAISQKIESLPSQKGLSPEVTEQFFNRIGKSAEDFKVTDAVRQLSSKVKGANTSGITWSELIQSVSAGLLTPKVIRDIAIATGKTQPVIKKLLENTAPTARKALLNSLLSPQ